jgi:diguanylate cyclase (GGDEF)-like protein
MDTPPEPEFEEISFLAASVFHTPVALVSLVDRDRQFFKSVVGADYPRETPRGMSFCNFAVLSQATVVIEDATRDPRVADNPLVTGGPGIRFYAGAPLITPEGHAVGTVCAIDFQPHHDVSANDIKALQFLATQTMRQMELRRLKYVEAEQRRQLEHLALYDTLTGLPNRVLLRTKLEEACARDQHVTVLLLDLDGFKDVNDTLGHEAGDLLLSIAASRIRSAVELPATVARMGGDEFAVVLPEVMEHDQIVALCERLLDAFRAPFAVDGNDIFLGVSIGVSSGLGATSKSSPGPILSDADIALYAAKEDHRGGYCFFQPSMRQAIVARHACEGDLRNAVAEGRLELFYQPQVRLEDRSIFGAEALLRWHHPKRGLLSPAAFLSVLERSSLSGAVGRWVIRAACRHAAEMRASGQPDYRIAVNLFAAQFRTSDLYFVVKDALSSAALPADALELEITENILLRQDAGIMRQLEDLRELGVSIAFDDYGTGYASLSVLKKYPLTTLKIDRSFICELNVNASDVAVVGAILYLGRSFGLKVIAEGVETAQQEDFLINLGCTSAQGYLYDRPMPSDVLIRKLCEPDLRKEAGGRH